MKKLSTLCALFAFTSVTALNACPVMRPSKEVPKDDDCLVQYSSNHESPEDYSGKYIRPVPISN